MKFKFLMRKFWAIVKLDSFFCFAEQISGDFVPCFVGEVPLSELGMPVYTSNCTVEPSVFLFWKLSDFSLRWWVSQRFVVRFSPIISGQQIFKRRKKINSGRYKNVVCVLFNGRELLKDKVLDYCYDFRPVVFHINFIGTCPDNYYRNAIFSTW